MGRQIVGIDSSIFIYVWNKHPEFLKKSKKILKQIYSGTIHGVFAEIGLVELLTGPKKQGRLSLAVLYKNKIKNFKNLETRRLTEISIDKAGDLRAKYGLRTPDAIHIATAIDAGASVFYTNDKKLKIVKEIKIKTL